MKYEQRLRAIYKSYISRTESAYTFLRVENEVLTKQMELIKDQLSYLDELIAVRADFLRMKKVIKSLKKKLSAFDAMELCPSDQERLKLYLDFKKPLV